MEMTSLNITIKHITGKRNKVADALSRTIFTDPECKSDEILGSLGHIDTVNQKWIWTDGKASYQELLKRRNSNSQTNIISACDNLTSGLGLATLDIKPIDKYIQDPWYADIFTFLTTGNLPTGKDAIQQETFKRKAKKFTLYGSMLVFIGRGVVMKRRILKKDVPWALKYAHSMEGHFSIAICMRKLRLYYWPNMTEDVHNYIASCIKCARFSIAQRSQLQSPVQVDAPEILFGIDFIGPLQTTDLTAKELCKLNWPTTAKYDDEDYLIDFDEGFYISNDRKGLTVSYILVLVDYFSRFVGTFATIGNTTYDVIRCLEWKFSRDGSPVGFYGDEGTHFTGHNTKEFLRKNRVIWIPAPSGAKKATGMVENCNDLLQRILKKTEAGKLWPLELQECVFNMNLRIINHLGFSPFEIEKGYQPTGILEVKLPSIIRTDAVNSVLKTNLSTVLERDPDYQNAVFNFIANRESLQFKVLENSDWQKMLQKERHD